MTATIPFRADTDPMRKRGPYALIPRLRFGLVCLLLIALSTVHLRADESASRHFVERAWPVLLARCVTCHGPEAQEGELRLDSRAAALRGGKHGPAMVPGKPKESLLLKSVLHETKDKKLAMPPQEKLAEKDVAALRRWIEDGVPWPDIPSRSPATETGSTEHIGDAWHDARNPIVRIFRGERLDLWSLKPVEPVALPITKKLAWCRNAIDSFILAKLESNGLTPSSEADKRTLARRLYFDLTGLPPAPEELELFLADGGADAYERLVDKLLASPRYGEHAARQWLDVVRYSDSNGFDWDEFRPRAWLFRDYVIRSLNADKPYDRFVREHLAGDELVAGPPQSPADQDALIATGFLRLGPQDNASALFNEQDRSRAEWMADLVETTGSAFLGLTYSCCRCHDHKFDPLSQADHFRLRAFFEPLKYADDVPLDLADEQAAIQKHNTKLDEKVQALEKKQKDTGNEKLAADIAALQKTRRNFMHGLLAQDAGGESPATKILYQGDYKHPKEEVSPGFLSALDPNPAAVSEPPNKNSSGRRLALANWIASPENPLTARVFVNRAWQMHFGRGLVATPNDFGLAGARPSHPELLDWLAGEFVRQGWSMKELHRLIVTSATYRQASVQSGLGVKKDAENALLWRQNLRRHSAEQLRDALLAVSVSASGKSSGPPVWPELPAEVLQVNPAFLDDNETKTKGWYPSPASEQGARTIFVVQKRTIRVPFLELFDLPENAVSCGRRNTSTVAPQAFSLLNSPLAIKAAQSFADRIKIEVGGDPRAQIERAYNLALQRQPTPSELASCKRLLEARGLVSLCRVLVNLNEFVYVD